MDIKDGTPWVEKYRPKRLDDIVLDATNKKIMEHMISKNNFSNVLFYGPPGTGKTTTIINLVKAYQDGLSSTDRGSMIHLNASDERGIDIIRNQINQFVNTKGLFNDGTKFVILDEVDYMTKNAQQALKYLLQNYSNNIRFCLICNYISRIDDSLQNEFIRLRFNQLPEKDIYAFLKVISINEKLNLSDDIIIGIQQLFNSDIRSMINYMQSNQGILTFTRAINNEVWNTLTIKITGNNVEEIVQYIDDVSRKQNLDKINIIKNYFNYIIRIRSDLITDTLLSMMENILHISECDDDTFIYYVIHKLIKIWQIK